MGLLEGVARFGSARPGAFEFSKVLSNRLLATASKSPPKELTFRNRKLTFGNRSQGSGVAPGAMAMDLERIPGQAPMGGAAPGSGETERRVQDMPSAAAAGPGPGGAAQGGAGGGGVPQQQVA